MSTVSTYPDCDALIGDLRRVGAEHVGSRGFGAFGDGSYRFSTVGAPVAEASADTAMSLPRTGPAAGGDDAGTTLGTNVQVAGVDELDVVKAVGSLIYDLDGKGNLRITDAEGLQVLSRLDVTPTAPERRTRARSSAAPASPRWASCWWPTRRW